ncbi:hypothetical protein LTR27_004953 [Elasticomyces elasticus]|nr:hypothetical protein LTR27_004953 [Elasticomyces elasticus]
MSSRSPHSPICANEPQPYRMHVSQRYLDLTKQKLELARLPREPQGYQVQSSDFGVTKAELEPLVDHWLEQYDWRKQEAFYNDTLPQFRAMVNGTRLHFVHRRSHSPDAIPLLFVHGFPESFLAAAPMIEALCDPIATPPRGTEGAQAFHVVVPSIPGFGFSDALPEEGNAMPTTAAMLDSLMKSLGYQQYIAHGTGWPSFGYRQGDLHQPGLTPPMTPGGDPRSYDRPQTLAYGLCDSPPGLLAYMLDLIQPLTYGTTFPNLQRLGPSRSPTMVRSPVTPQSGGTMSTGYQSPAVAHAIELPGLSTVWTPTALISWTMIYWLPGPEVALRWLSNSAAVLPSLWSSHSNVPLGITYFRDSTVPSSGTGQTPPQWAEAYHRVAMLTRREGRVRFPAWERPAEVVLDIRELASIVGAASIVA